MLQHAAMCCRCNAASADVGRSRTVAMVAAAACKVVLMQTHGCNGQLFEVQQRVTSQQLLRLGTVTTANHKRNQKCERQQQRQRTITTSPSQLTGS